MNLSRSNDRFRNIDHAAHVNAIAVIVLEGLRDIGLEPHQVLLWCRPNPSDSEFEDAMEAEHGIRVSAEAIKSRVHTLVVGS